MYRILLYFTLVLAFSCKNGTNKNLELIQKLIENPDYISQISKDTSIAIGYISEIDEKYKLRIINYLNEYFSGDYSVIRNELGESANKDFTFRCYIHEVSLRSNIDNSKKLYFLFVDFDGNKNWKLDEILFRDPIIDGPPDAHLE